MTSYVDVWSNVYKSNLNPLYVKQKHLIRLITKSGYMDHTANRLQSMNILPFFHLIKYMIAIFMYKLYHKMLPSTIQKLFTHYYLTRHSFTFFVNDYRTSNRQQCVVYAGDMHMEFIRNRY